jgi:hypothetical protein
LLVEFSGIPLFRPSFPLSVASPLCDDITTRYTPNSNSAIDHSNPTNSDTSCHMYEVTITNNFEF